MRKQPFSRQSEEKRDFVLKIAIVDGLSSVWVQYLALPCFGILFKLIVDAESGMILFLYLFIIDYLLVVRAAAFCICQVLFGYNFFSCQTGCSSSENTPPFTVSPRCRRVPPPCPSPRTTPAHSALPGWMKNWYRPNLREAASEPNRSAWSPNSTTAMHGLNGGTAYFMLRYYWTHNDTKTRYSLFI